MVVELGRAARRRWPRRGLRRRRLRSSWPSRFATLEAVLGRARAAGHGSTGAAPRLTARFRALASRDWSAPAASRRRWPTSRCRPTAPSRRGCPSSTTCEIVAALWERRPRSPFRQVDGAVLLAVPCRPTAMTRARRPPASRRSCCRTSRARDTSGARPRPARAAAGRGGRRPARPRWRGRRHEPGQLARGDGVGRDGADDGQAAPRGVRAAVAGAGRAARHALRVPGERRRAGGPERAYFAQSVGREVDGGVVAHGADGRRSRREQSLAALAGADWAFAGPGQPDVRAAAVAGHAGAPALLGRQATPRRRASSSPAPRR